MAWSTPRLLRRLRAKTIPSPKRRSLPKGLSAYSLDLVLQLRLLSSQFLILDLQLSDPAAQMLDFVILRRGRRSPAP